MTQVPAEIIGAYAELGSLTTGKQANFLITSGDVFEQGESIYQNWINGQKHEVSAMDLLDIRGVYNLNVNQNIRSLKVAGSEAKPSGNLTYDVIVDSISVKGDLVLDCFAGSATTAIAAMNTERDFVGCELDEEYYQKSFERINKNRLDT